MSSTGGLQFDSANTCTQLSEPRADTITRSEVKQ